MCVCVWASPADVRCHSAPTSWDYVDKHAALLRQSCKCGVKNHSFIHSFIHWVTSAQHAEWRNEGSPFHFFQAIYSRVFQEAQSETVDKFQGNRTQAPWRAFLPHFYSLLFFLKSSSWKYLANTGEKKKDFEGRKTTSRSWATHTPSAVVLSSFIIYRLCALIWFLQFGLVVIVVVLVFLVFFFLFVERCDMRQQEGGVGGMGGILPHVHLIVHSGPS